MWLSDQNSAHTTGLKREQSHQGWVVGKDYEKGRVWTLGLKNEQFGGIWKGILGERNSRCRHIPMGKHKAEAIKNIIFSLRRENDSQTVLPENYNSKTLNSLGKAVIAGLV